MIALKCIDSLKGKKLIVVPTRTLVEQWNWYIQTYIPHCKNEIDLITYQSYRSGQSGEYVLSIFDECHKLPADTFSRLAVVNTKYRIGLSASPHREDGRERYIFALTGFPVGLNWQEYMQTVGRSYHPIYVHKVRSEAGKIAKVSELLNLKKKTLIFCDSIELGKKIANQINVPFVYGETENRLELIEKNKVLVVSRVMDLGVSIKDLNQIIEVDFLFGSRQQELQRTGRLMHSEEKDVRHDIIFTDKELEDYGKRLWALQEKGFAIKVIE
jgi:DNA excision repair protein ERCC-3